MAGEEEAIEEEGGEEGGEALAPSASSGLNKIVKILIYVALGVVGVVLMSVIAYYVARFAAAQQYKEVSSIAIIKPPPPTESFNFPDDFRVNTADQSDFAACIASATECLRAAASYIDEATMISSTPVRA